MVEGWGADKHATVSAIARCCRLRRPCQTSAVPGSTQQLATTLRLQQQPRQHMRRPRRPSPTLLC